LQWQHWPVTCRRCGPPESILCGLCVTNESPAGTRCRRETFSAVFRVFATSPSDPNFALGYRIVGGDYNALAQLGRAMEYSTRAFQLRDHFSEREKLSIIAASYRNVTGELDKAAQTYQEQIDNYPREPGPYNNRGLIYAEEGQYEKALELNQQALRLGPATAVFYENLTNYTVALQRFDETRPIIREAQARKLDHLEFHMTLYAVASLGEDSAAMAQQQQWFAGKPDYENVELALASDREAYAGRLGKARGAGQARCGLRRTSR
jgi:tetratricopeptide (TPR) repeat protein